MRENTDQKNYNKDTFHAVLLCQTYPLETVYMPPEVLYKKGVLKNLRPELY